MGNFDDFHKNDVILKIDGGLFGWSRANGFSDCRLETWHGEDEGLLCHTRPEVRGTCFSLPTHVFTRSKRAMVRSKGLLRSFPKRPWSLHSSRTAQSIDTLTLTLTPRSGRLSSHTQGHVQPHTGRPGSQFDQAK